MATLGHIAVGMAAGRIYRSDDVSTPRLATAMLTFAGIAMAADLDVIAFALGIPYAAAWGHRGAVHSLAFALLVGLLGALVAKLGGRPPARAGLLTAAVFASHGLLDTLTDGGLGIALLWPLSEVRLFAPWQPLPVAPIGGRLLSAWGARVLLTELLYFAPLFLWSLWPRRGGERWPLGRRRVASSSED